MAKARFYEQAVKFLLAIFDLNPFPRGRDYGSPNSNLSHDIQVPDGLLKAIVAVG